MADLPEIRGTADSTNGPRNWDFQSWNSTTQVWLGFTGEDLNDTSFLLENMPSDFQSMDTFTYDIWSSRVTTGDDTIGLFARVVKESDGAVLAAADAGGAFETIRSNIIGTHPSAVRSTGSFTYVNTGASKTDWDDARLELRQTYTQNMGPDSDRVAVGPFNNAVSGYDDARFGGTYTVSGVFATVTPDPIATTTAFPLANVHPNADVTPDTISAQFAVPSAVPDVPEVVQLVSTTSGAANSATAELTGPSKLWTLFVRDPSGAGPRNWSAQDASDIWFGVSQPETINTEPGPMSARPVVSSHNNDTSFLVREMPLDLIAMKTLNWQVVYRGFNWVDDTVGLACRVVKESNSSFILAADDSGGAFHAGLTVATTSITTSSIMAFPYVNTTATRDDWNDARLEIRQTYSAVSGDDGAQAELFEIELSGSYTATGEDTFYRNYTPTTFFVPSIHWVTVPPGTVTAHCILRAGATSIVWPADGSFPRREAGKRWPSAQLECDLGVTPGDTLYLVVGGPGKTPTLDNNGAAGPDGLNGTGGAAGGDGNGNPGGSGGGAATSIRAGGTSKADTVALAGGRGGRNYWANPPPTVPSTVDSEADTPSDATVGADGPTDHVGGGGGGGGWRGGVGGPARSTEFQSGSGSGGTSMAHSAVTSNVIHTVDGGDLFHNGEIFIIWGMGGVAASAGSASAELTVITAISGVAAAASTASSELDISVATAEGAYATLGYGTQPYAGAQAEADRTVLPSVISISTTVPQATPLETVTVTPSTIAAVADLPAATTDTSSSTILASVIATQVAVPLDLAVTPPQTMTPATIAVIVAMETPEIDAEINVDESPRPITLVGVVSSSSTRPGGGRRPGGRVSFGP